MTPFERRTRACQDRLRASPGDAVVLFPSPNLYYLSGFHEEPAERHLLLFVPAEGDPVFVAPQLYDDQLGEATWVDDIRTYADNEDPLVLIDEVVADLGIASGHLLVDPTMWATFTHDLREILPQASFGLANEIMADLRVLKDDAELDALRRAGEIADKVMSDVRALGESVIGRTEADLAREIEERLNKAGGEGLAFDVIVGSGPNGAKPHHRHGDREIESGDPVVLDFGTRVDHYPSDQTRTVVFAGDTPRGFENAFEAVRDAQQAAVNAIKPGVAAAEIDAAAREVIKSRGYGEQFIHRTGHGVGLDVHEEPYIVGDNDRELEPGMVFSVEPGVYVEGAYGIRIEDLVVVTENGCERLNDSTRGWQPS